MMPVGALSYWLSLTLGKDSVEEAEVTSEHHGQSKNPRETVLKDLVGTFGLSSGPAMISINYIVAFP